MPHRLLVAREGGGSADPPQELRDELERLAAEAGVEAVVDPTPPSGDLKADIDSFTTVDACVRARKIADPLLGDAIDALGYDTLTRDACRMLDALKNKSTQPCRPIASSALRAKCESSVAVIAGDPSLCPVASTGGRLEVRDPVCLARANRDERLCVAALAPDRASCRALVLGRAAECGSSASCVREIERYKSLTEKPAHRPPLPARFHAEIVLEKEGAANVEVSGRAGALPADNAFDLDEVAAAGAVVRATGDKVRLSLGIPRNVAWLTPDAPSATPRAFVELVVPLPGTGPAAKKGAPAAPPKIPLEKSDLRLDLLVPKVALLSSVTAEGSSVELQQLSLEPGAPIRFSLASTIRDTPRTFRVKITVETFVREISGKPRKETP